MSTLTRPSRFPIFIMSFNRPDYLTQVLESLTCQTECDIAHRDIILFQDGAINPFSNKRHAADQDIEASINIFKRFFPGRPIMASPVNLGVALNFERAERLGFDEMKAPAVIFLEDDLVLNAHYISVLDRLTNCFLEDERVGYVAAYGDHTKQLEAQRAHRDRLILLTHNWGFALYRRQWLRMREHLLEYIKIIENADYNERDVVAIAQLFASWGYGCPATSQDGAKTIACCIDNVIKINTYVCNAAYIGKRGVHMNEDIFTERGYHNTVVYPEATDAFQALDAKLYSALLTEQRKWAAKSNSAKTETLAEAAAMPDLTPRMTSSETRLFTDFLQRAACYLEYGAGGSTLAAVRSPIKQIVSVETDMAWIERLKETEEIGAAMAAKRLTFRHVDLGPVGEWGVPKGDGKIRNWLRYAYDPFASTDLNFDAILVDGRFRVHCLLAVVNCAAPDARVFLHDYQYRHEYTVADKYFDTIERVESSVIMKIRQTINKRSLYIDLVNALFSV
jgi:hypothetical protein